MARERRPLEQAVAAPLVRGEVDDHGGRAADRDRAEAAVEPAHALLRDGHAQRVEPAAERLAAARLQPRFDRVERVAEYPTDEPGRRAAEASRPQVRHFGYSDSLEMLV